MKEYLAPIAIDLGASHTGVYSAFYETGTHPNQIEKRGAVYNLEKDAYTLLMAKRTASRHQRRGYDRRQMAKRLFRLIWTEHFRLLWNKDTAQTIGFLFNRRGFSFLAEEYAPSALKDFPLSAWEVLPTEFKQQCGLTVSSRENIDFTAQLFHWAENRVDCETAIKNLLTKQKQIKRDLLYYGKCKDLKRYCEMRRAGTPDKEIKKSRDSIHLISSWIYDTWHKNGVNGLPSAEILGDTKNNRVDVVPHLESKTPEELQIIIDSLDSLMLAENGFAAKEAEAKQSDWNFKETSFDLEKANLFDSEKNGFVQANLNNLAFALHKINEEQVNGGRHRSKYIQEIRDVLSESNHGHGYLNRFCTALQNGAFGKLTAETLGNLIGHISNLELKPLRKYFNDKKHQDGDKWDELELTAKFDNWILREWRVDANKNPYKAKGKPQDYKQLCDRWKAAKPNGIVAFWTDIDPIATIPPYQDNNNRRPPRCQSLVLNPDFLDKKYPQWLSWLATLKPLCEDYLEDIEDQLLALKTSKKKAYFLSENALTGDPKKDSQKLTKEKHLNVRILHFILDRRKEADTFLLNEIFSITKKLRQMAAASENADRGGWQQKLQGAIDKSTLPPALKSPPNFNTEEIFADGSFFHFICKYYKMRLRARDGRVFIHPDYVETRNRGMEFRNRFDSDSQLLTYCNLKPRQKKYQTLNDVAGVLQVSPNVLKKAIAGRPEADEDDNVVSWLKSFKGMATSCKKAADAQKEHRGQLKLRINAGNDRALVDLVGRCETLSTQIAASLNLPSEHGAKFKSIFSFAQLHNIAFMDRSGNANTCPICSLDNSRRIESSSDASGAKAQRLPAIPTRIIDGAVKRMARIVTKAIAEDNWGRIEREIKMGNRVRIPIITESNRFEYEPGLATLKGKKAKDIGQDQSFESKEGRIGRAGCNICPYTGQPSTNGQLDHIVPRTSQWGTINDEANLILASEEGNRQKTNRTYSLANLSQTYKRALFTECSSDAEIEDWIIRTIWDANRNNFTFGSYNSFINLTPEQQVAFRHALFLVGSDLWKRVIKAINNRTRALVNGTQRYFAETLANEFHRRALRIKKAHLLDFDYFGVEATSSTRGDGVKYWRAHYEECISELDEYKKLKGEAQKAYSHMLDAHVAFLITADKHRNEGSMGLQIPMELLRLDAFDMETGEVRDNNLFLSTWIHPDDGPEVTDLKRRKPNDTFCKHRSFTRDTFYADRYLPILLKKVSEKEVQVRAGFSWENSGEWKQNKKSREQLKRLLPLLKQFEYFPKEAKDRLASDNAANTEIELFNALVSVPCFQRQIADKGYMYFNINRIALHEFWVKHHNTKTGKPFDDLFDLCYKKLGYRTEKMKGKLTSEELLSDVLNNRTTFFEIKGFEQPITLPAIIEWENLDAAWNEARKEGKTFSQFVKPYFIKNTKKLHEHQKVRKEFSLPILTKQGKAIISKSGWDGTSTYQMINNPSGDRENQMEAPVITPEGKIESSLMSWAKSTRIVKLSKTETPNGKLADPEAWYPIEISLPKEFEKLWVNIADNTRPFIAIKFACKGSDISSSKFTFKELRPRDYPGEITNELTKKAQEIVDTHMEKVKLIEAGAIFTYKGSSFSTDEAFRKALAFAIPVKKPK